MGDYLRRKLGYGKLRQDSIRYVKAIRRLGQPRIRGRQTGGERLICYIQDYKPLQDNKYSFVVLQKVLASEPTTPVALKQQ